jgi:polyisoprenoid-binding protein YceI
MSTLSLSMTLTALALVGATIGFAACRHADGAQRARDVAATAGPDGAPSLPPPGTYALDPPHTFLFFAAKHQVVGMVRGRFDKASGTITVDSEPTLSAVDVAVETASLDTQNGVRDEDLRSAAYFDVSEFPTMTYRGRGVRRDGNGLVVDGTLTIRGVTRMVPLAFAFKGTAPAEPGKPARLAFHADARLKRADFGMTRGLLQELGPNPSGDDVTIEIDAEVLAAGSAH